MNRKKTAQSIALTLALVVMLICMTAVISYAKTYYKTIGNWQGWYEHTSSASVDGDTYRVKFKFGYKHTSGTLLKYKYTGYIATSGYKEAVSNVTATPTVPAAGSEATIGTGYIDLKKQHEQKTVTLKTHIKNNTTTSETENKTYTLTIPAKTSYKVAYDPSGGTGGPASQTKWYGETLTLSQSVPVRAGYAFKGWKASSSGSVYMPGDKYTGNAAMTLSAVWAEVKRSNAEIFVTNTLLGGVNNGTYRFRIVPDSGWKNDSVDTFKSGTPLSAGEIPAPDSYSGSDRGRSVDISGYASANNYSVRKSLAKISFTEPGWYMYKVYQEIPESRLPGVRYDTTSYYVVVYVIRDFKGDVRVINVTAWHNNTESIRNKPSLEEISKGNLPTDKGTKEGMTSFGKTSSGEQSAEVHFWNRQETATLRLRKNVKGSLGDRTKRFNFELKISGLGKGVAYNIATDGADNLRGETDGVSLLPGSDGEAVISFDMADDEAMEIEGLPPGAKYIATEGPSNHVAGYEIREGGSVVDKKENDDEGAMIVTEERSMLAKTESEIVFRNTRTIAPNTGRGSDEGVLLPVLMILAVLLLQLAASVRTYLRCRE